MKALGKLKERIHVHTTLCVPLTGHFQFCFNIVENPVILLLTAMPWDQGGFIVSNAKKEISQNCASNDDTLLNATPKAAFFELSFYDG